MEKITDIPVPDDGFVVIITEGVQKYIRITERSTGRVTDIPVPLDSIVIIDIENGQKYARIIESSRRSPPRSRSPLRGSPIREPYPVGRSPIRHPRSPGRRSRSPTGVQSPTYRRSSSLPRYSQPPVINRYVESVVAFALPIDDGVDIGDAINIIEQELANVGVRNFIMNVYNEEAMYIYTDDNDAIDRLLTKYRNRSKIFLTNQGKIEIQFLSPGASILEDFDIPDPPEWTGPLQPLILQPQPDTERLSRSPVMIRMERRSPERRGRSYSPSPERRSRSPSPDTEGEKKTPRRSPSRESPDR